MKTMNAIAIALALVLAPATAVPIEPAGKAPAQATQRTFDTPRAAADALIAAAADFDVAALKTILGPSGVDLVETGDLVQDRATGAAFASLARQKSEIVLDPRNLNRAILVIGDEDWPSPIPIVRKKGKWSFDTKAGRQEILNRRIGRNELDAIEVAHAFVEAQQEYAFRKRAGYDVNQYAQRIVSTPGTQDGLAWRNPDGTWVGPLGEGIANIIAEGYSNRARPTTATSSRS